MMGGASTSAPSPREIAETAMTRARTRCGVKTRSGAPCQAKAVQGGLRCRQHSVAEPGNLYAATPGSLYSRYLSDEERAMVGEVEATVGDLRHELMYAKMMVARFAEKLAEPEPEREEAESTVETRGDGALTGSSIATTTRVRSHQAEADRWIARVAALTKQLYDAEAQRLSVQLTRKNIALADLEIEMRGAVARDLAHRGSVSGFSFEIVDLAAEASSA